MYSVEIKKLVRGTLTKYEIFDSMEYLNVLGEIKLLNKAINLLLYRTAVVQYVNTAIL